MVAAKSIVTHRLWSLLKAWMKLFQSFAQKFSVKMRVDLSCGNTFMPKHFLNGTKVRASFNQVRCKRMTESVGRNIFFDACLSYQVFYDQKNHYTG